MEDSKLNTTSCGKRLKVDDVTDVYSVQDMDMIPRIVNCTKKSNITSSPLKHKPQDDGGYAFIGDEDNHHSPETMEDDYEKGALPIEESFICKFRW